jgi:cyclin B
MQINENIFSFQNSFRPITSNSNNLYFNNYINNFNIIPDSNIQKYYQTSREFGKEISYLNNLTTYTNQENIYKNSIYTNNTIYDKSSNINFNYNKKRNINEIKERNIKTNQDENFIDFQFINNPFKEQVINNEIIANAFMKKDNNSFIKSEEKKPFINDIEMKNEEKEEKTINNNPQEVNEYFNDIYNNLLQEEKNFIINPNYMSFQNDINEKMRAILLDWLIEVHLKFKLMPETMYITVNLIDRYLEKKLVKRTKLQLVGVTAMLIACKYEEIYPPEIKDFVYITDKAYTKNEVLDMEIDMLKTLNYDITFPTQYKFLEFYRKKLNLDDCSFFYCWYCIELCLIEYKMNKYNSRVITASACLITLHLFKIYSDNLLENVTGFKIDDLMDCAKDICLLIENGTYNLQAVKKKFSLSKYMNVAKIQFG